MRSTTAVMLVLAATLATLPLAAKAENRDGRYTGPLNYQVTSNSSHAHCRSDSKGILRVHGDTVTVSTVDGPQTTPLATDGGFTVRDGARVITGKVAGGTASGVWTNGACTAHFEFPRGE